MSKQVRHTSVEAKLVFSLPPDDWHGHDTESLWVAVSLPRSKKHAQLLNSPFFAKGVSYGDIVGFSGSKTAYMFEKVVEKSGYATLRLLIDDNASKLARAKRALEKLKLEGCRYEGGVIGNSRIFSIAVPRSAVPTRIVRIVDSGCDRDLWDAEVGDTAGRTGFWSY